MSEYSFTLANDVPLAEEQLLNLHQKCFGHYEGVLPFDRPTLSWYLTRPGLGLDPHVVSQHQIGGL